MLTIIQIFLLTLFLPLLLYLAFLSAVAVIQKDRAVKRDPFKRKFLIVVPAHNESSCIQRTLKNLFNINYDKSRYNVMVVADNCSDNTAELALDAGACVWNRVNMAQRGKGHALRWCFDRLLANREKYDYDSVVVVDADSIVSKNILEVMNSYRSLDKKVIQGYLTVDAKLGSWTSEIINVGFTLYNYVRPLARRALGLPAGLRGNGMCFSLDVLEQVPWNAYSQTEDFEYSISLLLNDIDIFFAPEAIGFSIVPEKAKNAESQRERWEMGRFPVLQKYFGILFRKAIRQPSLKVIDKLIDLVIPPVVNLILGAAVMTLVSGALLMSGLQQNPLFFWLWVTAIGLGIFHALIGLASAKADIKTFRSLLYVPQYALWKLYIYAKIILVKGRTSEWVRTQRE